MSKCIIGEVRFSYANVFEPAPCGQSENAPLKYSVTLLLPKTNTAMKAKIDKSIADAEEVGAKEKWAGKIPKVYKNPTIKDGDEPNDETGEIDPVTKGHWIIKARSNSKPGLVDRDLNPIMNREEFYSGCYGRASITFFPYFQEGTKGISAGLNNLQKLRDGERLAGGASAEEDFGGENAIESDDDLM